MTFRENRLEIIRNFRENAPTFRYHLDLNPFDNWKAGEHRFVLEQTPFSLPEDPESLFGYSVAYLRDKGFLSNISLGGEPESGAGPNKLVCQFSTDLEDALCVTENLCHWLRQHNCWDVTHILMKHVFTSSCGKDWEEFPALAIAEKLGKNQLVAASLPAQMR